MEVRKVRRCIYFLFFLLSSKRNGVKANEKKMLQYVTFRRQKNASLAKVCKCSSHSLRMLLLDEDNDDDDEELEHPCALTGIILQLFCTDIQQQTEKNPEKKQRRGRKTFHNKNAKKIKGAMKMR